ncbi:PAS domain S-box protein [Thermodesulfobacteriota bacterium]
MKSIKYKLLIFIGITVLIFSAILLQSTYSLTTSNVEDLTKQQLSLALNFDLAIRDYVAEKIRPVMFNLVSEGEFIPETMSTSFVARNIFEKVRIKFPDYIIKFSSGNPRNPVNQAGPEELKMIKYFNDNPQDQIWTGQIEMGGMQYLANFSAMRMEKACLRCHGNPADAPIELIKRYGPNASFYRPLGEIVGLDTIAIPSDTVKQILWNEKLKNIGFLGVLIAFLIASLVFVFKFTITDRLTEITAHFLNTEKQSIDEKIGIIELKGEDEIAVLTRSFNKMAERLNDSYDKLKIEIEDRKQAQKALIESEHRLRTVINNAPVVLWAIDKNGVFTFTEGHIFKKLGIIPGEGIGHSIFERHADNKGVVSDARRVLAGETFSSTTEFGGIIFDNRHSPIVNDDGDVIGAIGVAMDVTSRKQAEIALKESEEKYRKLFDMESDALALIDVESGNIIDVNKSFIKLYGYSRKEILGMKNIDFSAEPDKTAKATQNREQYIPIRNHKKKDGSVFPVEITASIFEHQGRNVHIAAIRDISHRVHIEAQLKTSLKDKEILLREIHHRVKNNFEIISSLLDLSGMQKKNRKGYKLLADTRSRIHSMALIHEQLYQSKRFDRINMFNYTREMVDYIAHIYANKENSINTVIDPSGVYLSVDQAIPCALAINELIANAFKHGFILKNQGTIYISIVNLKDDTVLIRVKDDGDGISKKIDPNEAPGLGLKLIRHLIEGQLGGEMDVRGDDGTEFCLQFKRAKLSEKA